MEEYLTCNDEQLDASKHATEAAHAYTKCFMYLRRGSRPVISDLKLYIVFVCGKPVEAVRQK